MNGHRVRPSDSIKYLGIFLDSTLSGKSHCEILTKKLQRANGMLSKIRHYVPSSELRSIYHAIFSSHIMYGCQIWGQSITTDTEKVFKLQNRALRIIDFADYRADVNPIYASKSILKLEDNIKMQNCLFVYDFLNKNLPECFDNYFQRLEEIYTEDITTINSELGCLYTPFVATTKYGLQSITRQCIKSWNFFTKELNTDLSKLSRSLLKNRITSHFIALYDPENSTINIKNINNRPNRNNGGNNSSRNNNNNNDNNQINNHHNNFDGIQVLRRVRNNNHGQLRVPAQNPPFATRWDNPLRNF